MDKLRIRFTYIIFSICFLFCGNSFSQDIEVVFHQTVLSDTLGDEMVFDFEVINISNMIQTVFVVRTVNELPAEWTSSLCFGINCFAPGVDSVATTPPLEDPLDPGDTLIASLHVTTQTNEGTANVELQIGTFRTPEDRIIQNFVANSPVSVEDEGYMPNRYYLSQNYPNPFNPSTKINYGLGKSGYVSVKVYDVLGNEIIQLVNSYQSAGNYEIDFNGDQFTSGIYLFRLETDKYSETRKMILEK